jgi:hypothetical protein
MIKIRIFAIYIGKAMMSNNMLMVPSIRSAEAKAHIRAKPVNLPIPAKSKMTSIMKDIN